MFNNPCVVARDESGPRYSRSPRYGGGFVVQGEELPIEADSNRLSHGAARASRSSWRPGDRGADHNEDNAKLPALALRDTLMDK